MHQSVIDFATDWLPVITADLPPGIDVLEVGSLNVNGSVRPIAWDTDCIDSYTGIDIQRGPGVDGVVSAEEITTYFKRQFDLIICTEMLEHAENWRECINEMKSALKPGGKILITTRGPGFPYHEYPGDYWRYTVNDMFNIFRDFEIEVCTSDPDPNSPGVFLIASKPEDWEPCDLSDIELATPVI